jgi:hypothetical protein
MRCFFAANVCVRCVGVWVCVCVGGCERERERERWVERGGERGRVISTHVCKYA